MAKIMGHFRCEPELLERLKAAAEKERRTYSQVVEMLVEDWLNGQSKPATATKKRGTNARAS